MKSSNAQVGGGPQGLKVAIVGGVWDKPADYQRIMEFAPERLLADGLENAGAEVDRFGHFTHFQPASYDVVHVHCAAWGVVRVLEDRSQARFLYTNHLSSARNRRVAYLTKAAMQTADCVVALSHSEEERLARRYRVPGWRVAVIPNGIDATAFSFSPPEPPPPGLPWRLIFVGQLIPMKAPDLLVRSLAAMRGQLDVRLELVYQNAELETDLRSLVVELGLTGAVDFRGMLHPSEVAERIRASHILVLPSRHSEELPATITQAMLCGRQVVATDIGAIREQLAGLGVVVPPGDVDALTQGILEAIGTYSGFLEQALPTQQTALSRFSIHSMVDAHVAAYRRSLNSAVPLRAHGAARVSAFAARMAAGIYRPFSNRPPEGPRQEGYGR